MRLLASFAATLVAAACTSPAEVRARHTASAPEMTEVRMKTVQLRDGAHIAYSPADDEIARLTPP
jgi:hypothetical protein